MHFTFILNMHINLLIFIHIDEICMALLCSNVCKNFRPLVEV